MSNLKKIIDSNETAHLHSLHQLGGTSKPNYSTPFGKMITESINDGSITYNASKAAGIKHALIAMIMLPLLKLKSTVIYGLKSLVTFLIALSQTLFGRFQEAKKSVDDATHEFKAAVYFFGAAWLNLLRESAKLYTRSIETVSNLFTGTNDDANTNWKTKLLNILGFGEELVLIPAEYDLSLFPDFKLDLNYKSPDYTALFKNMNNDRSFSSINSCYIVKEYETRRYNHFSSLLNNSLFTNNHNLNNNRLNMTDYSDFNNDSDRRLINNN